MVVTGKAVAPPPIPRLWPSLAIIAGGALMAVLWFRFTTLHGPTSYNRDGEWLGRDALFWGSMMSAPASLLIASGLLGHRRLLVGLTGRKARIGFALTMISLIVPSVVELALLANIPPLLAPLSAVGLLLFALEQRRTRSLPQAGQASLFALAALMALSFAIAIVPLEVSDRYDGFRVFGITSNVLFGLGWMVVGTSLARATRRRYRTA